MAGEAADAAVGILGAGRLGASLALALDRSGHAVEAVASRDAADARTLAASLSSARARSPEELVAGCDLVFATVPDAALPRIAAELDWRSGQSLVHTSGALGLGVLSSAAERGAQTGCLHPLQSFPSRDGEPERFRGIRCGVEGSGSLGPRLERLARALGAEPLRLEGVDRAAYHAAAVLASNYVVGLAAAAARVWERAGLPRAEAREALAPLMRGATDALARLPLSEALTGPVARADLATVERHLAALADAPDLLALYRALGRELLGLDLGHDASARDALARLLAGVE